LRSILSANPPTVQAYHCFADRKPQPGSGAICFRPRANKTSKDFFFGSGREAWAVVENLDEYVVGVGSAGHVLMKAAGMMAKYFEMSLAMLNVVSAPRVIKSCFPISTISISLVGLLSRSTMLPASLAACVPVFMATATSPDFLDKNSGFGRTDSFEEPQNQLAKSPQFTFDDESGTASSIFH